MNFKKGVSDLAEQLCLLGKTKFNEWFSHQAPDQRSGLTILLAGYSKDDAKPQTYQLSSHDNFVPRKSPTGFDCIGIPVIANYMLNRLYEPGITVENAAKLATFCIKETSSQDNRVGGPTQIATFSNTKQYAELSRAEIEKMEKTCEQYRLLQKNIFYPEDTDIGPSSSRDATKSSQ